MGNNIYLVIMGLAAIGVAGLLIVTLMRRNPD